MPIDKLLVVHKFGIISQSQRVDLEERIARKALLENQQRFSSSRTLSRPLPFEVTEDFVFKFNDSSKEDKEKLEDDAMKMLQRLQRLAGLREAGEAYHSDLGRAWVDLALLAQCRSARLEEACLETLLASLDQAFILEENVLSLFYLAKSGIHWLKRDSLDHQTVLRSGEIKLLKMTYLVFLRLYCHHIVGHLKGYEDQQISLAQYLKGFSEKREFYNQLPGGYRSLQFILESGYVICNPLRPTLDQHQMEQPDKSNLKFDEGLHTTDNSEDYFIQTNTDGVKHGTFLWHALNVWYTVNYKKFRLNNVLYSLFENTSYLAQESWINILVAFHVLSDASSHSLAVLEAFQRLIALMFAPGSKPAETVTICQNCYSTFSSHRDKKPHNPNQLHADSPTLTSPDEHKLNSSPNVLERLQAFVELEKTNVDNNKSRVNKEELNTPLTYEDREHVGSSKDLVEEQTYQMMSRMTLQRPNYRWPWELLYTFCECMTNICVNGSSATIRKVALLGQDDNKEIKRSYGLVDFLQYRKVTHDKNDDAFKVRCGAVRGLVLIYRRCYEDNTKEGLRNVAWSYLTDCQSTEDDPRVLDAIKVGKVEADLQNKLSTEHIPVSLLSSRLAAALSQVSHPKQPRISFRPRASPTTITCTSGYSNPSVPTLEKSQPKVPTRPSLRQEINLSNALQSPRMNYNTRASRDLRAVIEDQWKKELHEENEKELETSAHELETKRTEEMNNEVLQN